MEDIVQIGTHKSQDTGTFPYIIMSVFDGHSGAECAKFLRDHLMARCSSELHKTALRNGNNSTQQQRQKQRCKNSPFDEKDPHELDMIESIQRSFLDVDNQFRQRLLERDPRELQRIDQSGSTANMVFLRPLVPGMYADVDALMGMDESKKSCDRGRTTTAAMVDIYCANTGDTRCVLFDGGIIIALSRDHRPTQKQERKRIMKTRGSFVQDGRVNGVLATSRAFGDYEFKQNEELSDREQIVTALPDVEHYIVTISHDDLCDVDEPYWTFVLNASDGLFDVMSNEQVCQFVERELDDIYRKTNARLPNTHDVERICSKLVRHAIDSCGSDDNVSLCLAVILPLI